MPKTNLILSLAKVIIAAAWADGEVAHDEINSLKDLLFHMPEITAADWAELEIYIESPVDARERSRLVEELKAELATPSDMKLALSSLEKMIEADGTVTEAERAVVEQIKDSLQEVNVSIFGQLARLVRGPIQRRTQAVANAPNRERYLEDFVRNKIFFQVGRRLDMNEVEMDIEETELRKLSLAGGLMAQVAFVDREVTEGEREAMAAALQNIWDLSTEQAALVVEVAESEISKHLDLYRLAREFYKVTSEEMRRRFLEVLFSVARGDGELSSHEIEEIRSISKILKMTHKQFIQAKTSVT